MMETGIRIAQTHASEPRAAVRELCAALAQPDLSLVIFFCSSELDLDAVADEMARLLAGVQVIGCTTAGEIGPAGYRTQSLAGVSFSEGVCSVVTGRIEGLRGFAIEEGEAFARDMLDRLGDTCRHGRDEAVPAGVHQDNTFAFLLVDGLSVREELVAHSLQRALGEIPLVGGSAGDGLEFNHTTTYYDGRFFADSAVLALIHTSLPFRTFMTQHFVPTQERLVVTEADPCRRVVTEINGLPAAEEYARILGMPVDALGPSEFARSPLVVLIDGANYVRSIQKINSDGSLTFFCAIESGLVLRVATGGGLVADLESTLTWIRSQIGPPQVVLACDCILRRLEAAGDGLEAAVGDILRQNHAVGFSTYGEQYCGVHVNQTLTGIALGA